MTTKKNDGPIHMYDQPWGPMGNMTTKCRLERSALISATINNIRSTVTCLQCLAAMAQEEQQEDAERQGEAG